MLVRGYFNNYMTQDEESMFVWDIEADKEQIENCVGIANCLYQSNENDLEEYDFPMGLNSFMNAYDNNWVFSSSPFVDYLSYVFDAFGIDWCSHKIDCDLEICIN